MAHARAEYPRECCGVVAQSPAERYFPCRNLADNPTEQFHLAPEDYVAAAEWGTTITLIVHSHPDATTQPSELDKAQCDAMELPWAIASWPEGDLRTLAARRTAGGPPVRAGAYRLLGAGHELLPAGARPGVARLSLIIRGGNGVKTAIWITGTRAVSRVWRLAAARRYGDHAGFGAGGQPRRHSAGRWPVAAPYVRHAQPAVPYGGYWKERTVKVLRHKALM